MTCVCNCIYFDTRTSSAVKFEQYFLIVTLLPRYKGTVSRDLLFQVFLMTKCPQANSLKIFPIPAFLVPIVCSRIQALHVFELTEPEFVNV
jgi:hypothetical protein